MWSNQLSRLIFAIEKLIAYLYTPCSVPDKGMKTLLLWSLIKRRVDRFGGIKWIAITIIESLATDLMKIFTNLWPPRFDIIYEKIDLTIINTIIEVYGPGWKYETELVLSSIRILLLL